MRLLAYVYIRGAPFVNSHVDLTLLDAYGRMPKALGWSRGERVDSRLDRLFSSLGASFDAALDREEEEAASDLAMSLRQGRSLRERLVGRACAVVQPDGDWQVNELGPDHVGTVQGWWFPLHNTVVQLGGSDSPPTESEETLVERLRAAARSGQRIEIRTASRGVHGLLLGCGPDHLGIRLDAGEMLVPLTAVTALRLSRGG